MTPAGANTWNKIVDVYFNLPDIYVPQYPGVSLRVGSRGDDVLIMQKYLNNIAGRYTSIPKVTADGVFGAATQAAVTAFQRQFGLTADGIIGRNTWNKIVSINNKINMEQSGMNLYSTLGIGGGNKDFDKIAMLMLFRMFWGFY